MVSVSQRKISLTHRVSGRCPPIICVKTWHYTFIGPVIVHDVLLTKASWWQHTDHWLDIVELNSNRDEDY
ncbi:hypothetical protein E2C01_028534 [Portunus trituberculatus]|uniref:Uncharacterized protein n=1 Tax=Portunus trituberculatus TaxID=210409 RepID=A0A5B7EKP4_PORTR|nr:hypothetical protein [Portunus trituberculatus]